MRVGLSWLREYVGLPADLTAGQLDAAYAVGASSAQPGLLGPRTFSRVQHGPDNRAGYYEH